MKIKAMIEIRSNINAMVDDLVQKEAERKAREEAERKAKWEREDAERKAKEAKWKKEHPNLDKFTYCSHYNYNYFNFEYYNPCELYFYEWSNIMSQPVRFSHMARFYDFLDKCGIALTEAENNELKRGQKIFVVCKPNSKTLIIGSTYEGMVEQYRTAEETSKVLETVPEI